MWFYKVLLVGFVTLGLQAQEVFRDEYLIKSNVLGISLDSQISQAGATVVANLNNGVMLVRPKTAKAVIKKEDKVVKYNPNDDYCNYLLKNGVAKLCSPNYLIKLSEVPNDAYYPQLWGLNKSIEAEKAWDVATGSDAVVAVIDTGVDYNHPDLAANMWVNPFEVRDGRDNDGNGYIDDIHGINAVNNSGDPIDRDGHGTHCSGTIAGVGNNGVGVVGVNRSAKIMGLRFFDDDGYASTADAIKAFDYVISMKQKGVNIKITSNSWGSSSQSSLLDDAIARVNQAGVIVVAAAGNDANDTDVQPNYPSNTDLPNVISVAAIDSNSNLASFSNYGFNTVDIAAPGVGILSTTPNGTYSSYSGTSMATPHVAGALSLLAGLHPELSIQDLIKRLYETASPLPSLTGIVKTGRSLNLHRLVTDQRIPLDNTLNKIYNVNEIGYTPDTSADSQTSVINADEAGYEEVNLPFNFPFGQNTTNKVVLSPNGVIYLKNQPEAWDFKSSSLAPLFSVAAFHTDLNTINGGVKYKVTSDKITVYWKATHYRYEGLGFIEVRTTLYNNGIIRTFVKAPGNELLSLGTIGVTFSDSTSAHALKASHNNFGVQFTPVNTIVTELPNQNSVSISNIKLGVKNASKYRTNSKKISLIMTGSGTGTVRIQASFDGYKCTVNPSIAFANGASLTANLSANMKRFNKLNITVAGKSSLAKISSTKTKQKSLYLKRACSDLVRNLK